MTWAFIHFLKEMTTRLLLNNNNNNIFYFFAKYNNKIIIVIIILKGCGAWQDECLWWSDVEGCGLSRYMIADKMTRLTLHVCSLLLLFLDVNGLSSLKSEKK